MSDKGIYNIIEVANTHAGSVEYIYSLIEEFSVVSRNNMGIKFQPFSADGISHHDFKAHSLYKELEIQEEHWVSIIKESSKYFDVWLDMFDEYSVKVLKDNIHSVTGIKFQSSTLKNYRLRRELKQLSLNNIKLMVNVAGYDLDAINAIISELKDELLPEELILQVGFQDYPTSVEDCGLHKIKEIRNIFSGNICFADHSDGQEIEAIILPILAITHDCNFIEKHIMHSSLETKYDAASSVVIDTYREILKQQESCEKIFNSSFLVDKEIKYLENSYQMPIAGRELFPGDKIDLLDDVEYKRTDQNGLNVVELEKIVGTGTVLLTKIEKGQTFKKSDF